VGEKAEKGRERVESGPSSEIVLSSPGGPARTEVKRHPARARSAPPPGQCPHTVRHCQVGKCFYSFSCIWNKYQSILLRFSGLDNILFDHEPMKRAFLTQQLVGCPEDLDAVAFGKAEIWVIRKWIKKITNALYSAHSLFSMCSGYEVTSPHLTSEDWVHVRAHPQVR